MNFTQDEMNMICIYNGGSREKTLAELREMRGYLEPDEKELRELTDATIAKLEKISDAEFDKLDLIPDFLEEWEDMNAG